MFHRQELFESIEPLDPGEIDKVTGIGGHSLKLCGKGTVILPIWTTSNTVEWLRITNAIYCPELSTNLLSCLHLIQSGMKVQLDSDGATNGYPNKVTFTASIS